MRPVERGWLQGANEGLDWLLKQLLEADTDRSRCGSRAPRPDVATPASKMVPRLDQHCECLVKGAVTGILRMPPLHEVCIGDQRITTVTDDVERWGIVEWCAVSLYEQGHATLADGIELCHLATELELHKHGTGDERLCVDGRAIESKELSQQDARHCVPGARKASQPEKHPLLPRLCRVGVRMLIAAELRGIQPSF